MEVIPTKNLPWFSASLLFFLSQCMGLFPLFPSMLPHLLFYAHFLLLGPHSHPLHFSVSFPTSTSSFLHVLSLSFILSLCHLPIPSCLCFPVLFFPNAISIIGWFSARFSLSLSLSIFPLFSPLGTQACLSPFVSGMPSLWIFRHLQVCLFLSSYPFRAV